MASKVKVNIEQDAIYAEAEFSRGIVRDIPRSSIPVGGVYDSVDFLVDKPGVLRKRGGTEKQPGLTGANTAGVKFVCAPEFPSGTRVFALGADGNLYNLSDIGDPDASPAPFGSIPYPVIDNPHLYVDRVIVPSGDGITAPKKVYVNGSSDVSPLAVADWGGTPPPGRFATVHLSRVILASTADKPHRVYFSPVPNPETTWDSNPTTGKGYVDTNHFISGIVPCQGVLLVFSGGHTERIVGDIIPGQVGENMSLQPVGEVGCCDARSICAWRGNVVFAGQGGIWVTNGVGFDSLIEKDDGSGIASYWRELYETANFGDPVFAAGILSRDYYVLSITDGTNLVDTLICYLPRKAWTRMSRVGITSFANSFVGASELYGGTSANRPGNRVVRFSPILDPTDSNVTDHDSVNVEPDVQFRMIGEGIGTKAYGHGHLTYELGMEHGIAVATLAITAAYGIEASTGWIPIMEGSPMVATANGPIRKRFMINRDAQTLNLRITQTGRSAQTEIYAVEQEVRPFNATADSGIYGFGA